MLLPAEPTVGEPVTRAIAHALENKVIWARPVCYASPLLVIGADFLFAHVATSLLLRLHVEFI